MRHLAIVVVIGLAVLSTTNYAHAAACVNGVYRAGCTGPNGTAVVRKPPQSTDMLLVPTASTAPVALDRMVLLASANDPKEGRKICCPRLNDR
jgi:hypothetical protein